MAEREPFEVGETIYAADWCDGQVRLGKGTIVAVWRNGHYKMDRRHAAWGNQLVVSKGRARGSFGRSVGEAKELIASAYDRGAEQHEKLAEKFRREARDIREAVPNG